MILMHQAIMAIFSHGIKNDSMVAKKAGESWKIDDQVLWVVNNLAELTEKHQKS